MMNCFYAELGKIVPQYFDKFLLLERLDLSHNALAVLESLPTLPRLTELSLAHNYMCVCSFCLSTV